MKCTSRVASMQPDGSSRALTGLSATPSSRKDRVQQMISHFPNRSRQLRHRRRVRGVRVQITRLRQMGSTRPSIVISFAFSLPEVDRFESSESPFTSATRKSVSSSTSGHFQQRLTLTQILGRPRFAYPKPDRMLKFIVRYDRQGQSRKRTEDDCNKHPHRGQMK